MPTSSKFIVLLLAPLLSPLGSAQESQPAPDEPRTAWELLRRSHDKNGDGTISRSEYSRGDERFARLDADRDGVLTSSDLASLGVRRRGRSPRRGSGPPILRIQPPKLGEPAPDFTLPLLERETKPGAPEDGKGGEEAAPEEKAAAPTTVSLSHFAGKKPVALIFGSYT